MNLSWNLIKSHSLICANRKHQITHRREMSQTESRRYFSILKESLSNSRNFSLISLKNTVLDKLIITQVKNDPFEGRIVKIHELSRPVSDMNFFEQGLSEIKSFYGKSNRRIIIDVNVLDKEKIKLIEMNNLKQSGARLIGEVEDSLAYIDSLGIELNDGYSMRTLSLCDLKQSLLLELDVHEPMSVLRNNGTSRAEIKKYTKKIIENKKVVGVFCNKELIAQIGWGVKNGDLGYIASIAVSREFQGQQLSYILYQRVLKEFLKKKLSLYYGFSSTGKVLKQARKLSRRVFEYQYEFRTGL